MKNLLEFSVGGIHGSLPLNESMYMIRMVKFSNKYNSGQIENDCINLHGKIIPVYSLRSIFGLPYRSPQITDNLIITLIDNQEIALWVDSTYFIEAGSIVNSIEEIPLIIEINNSGLHITKNGVVVIDNLNLFLNSINLEPKINISDIVYRHADGALNHFKSTNTEVDLLGPQKTDKILEDRANDLARPLKDVDESTLVEVLKFQLAYKEYAIEMKYIREVILTREITPVPGTPEYIMGICAIRGEIISLIDLCNILSIPKTGLTDLNQVIVLTDGNITFGILTDDITGIENIPVTLTTKEEIEPVPVYQKYLLGIREGQVIVLDALSLLSDPLMIIDETGV